MVKEWGEVHEAAVQHGSSVNRQMKRNTDVHITSSVSIQSTIPSYRMVFSTLRLGCTQAFTFHTSCSVLSRSPWRDWVPATPCLYSAVLWHHGIRLHNLFQTASFMPTQPVAAHDCYCHVLLAAWKVALIPWTTPAVCLTCQNPLLDSCFKWGGNIFISILTTGAPF